MDSEQLAQMVARILQDRKGVRPVILNLEGLTIVADYFVIVSAPSSRRVKALADAVEEQLKEHGVRVHHREGYKLGRWILLDYGPVVVNVFHEEERSFYNLERLWGDAKMETFEDVTGPHTSESIEPNSS